MKNLLISILFFALCITTSNVLLAQGHSDKSNSIPNIDSLLTHLDLGSILKQVNVDSIMHNVNVDSIMHSVNIDSIIHQVNFDSLMGRLNIDSLWQIAKPKLEGMFESSLFISTQNSDATYTEEFDRPKPLASI